MPLYVDETKRKMARVRGQVPDSLEGQGTGP